MDIDHFTMSKIYAAVAESAGSGSTAVDARAFQAAGFFIAAILCALPHCPDAPATAE